MDKEEHFMLHIISGLLSDPIKVSDYFSNSMMEGEDRSGPPDSNEPADYKLKQQQLPAWQPALTAGTVLPTFFIVGVAFIPIGVGLLHLSSQVSRLVRSRFIICC